MKRTLLSVLIAVTALMLTHCSGCPDDDEKDKDNYPPVFMRGHVPVRSTESQSAADTAKTKVNVHLLPDLKYTEVLISSYSPYGVIGPASALAAILAQGTKAFLASPAAPANVGLASQLAALGDFKGDGTVGGAYLPNYSSQVTVVFATSQLAYGTSRSFTVGSNPAGVIAADFNGDGKTDLAVAYKNGIAILLSNGDGTFAGPVSYAAGSSPISLAALDLNHDGKLDLAAADNGSSPGKVYILLGTGTGTFTAGGSFTVGSQPLSVTIADFSNDGNPDLAVTANDNTTTILLGAGNGTFAGGSSLVTGAAPQYVAAGDFNKDGNMDLAVANTRAQTVSVFLGNGKGTFQAGQSYVVSYEPQSLIITDYNSDGNLDIIQGTGDARVFGPGVNNSKIDFLPGNGDGTFQGAVSTAVPGSQAGVGTFLSTGDFSGDGKIDAIVNDKFGGNLYLFPGDGHGRFQAPVIINALATGTQTLPVGGAAGDFNGDGKLDLAVTESAAGQVAVLLNSAAGLQLSRTFSSNGSIPGAIAAADLNGDGTVDLAVANEAIQYPFTPGSLTVFNGDGHGAFQLSRTYSAGKWPKAVAVADLSGDKKPDLVVADNGGDPGASPRPAGAVYVFINDGRGGFQTPAALTVGAYPSVVAIGDLNGDGKPDLVVGAENANVSYTLATLFGNGDGTFQAPVTVSTLYGPSGVVIGDFNGDGKADLMVSHCCGATDMTYLQGNGDGTFSAQVHFTSAANSFAVASADLSADGKPDLIIGGSQPLSVTPMLNNVRTAFGVAATHSGDFTAGQSGAAYSVVVSNAGSQATLGTVIVKDVLPTDLTLVSMSGTGWSCTGNSCTRNDALNPGSSFPAITVTINVAADAPAQVTNQVGVAGGSAGQTVASDPTNILHPNGNPVPTITSLSPTSVIAGGAALTLTANGTNFVSTSVIQWNGSNRSTNFVSSTRLTATIPAGDIAAPGTASVTAVSPPPGGGTSNPVTFTISAGTVAVAVATNPTGKNITVDGASFTAPQIFSWNAGSSHTIAAVTPQGAGGTRYVFANWSDGGGISHTITVPTSATTYTASFATQYLLTTAASPPSGGFVSANPSSTDGYYASGTTVQLTAAPYNGYFFSGWSGDLTGTANPQPVIMSAAHGVTANFSGLNSAVGVTVGSGGAASVFTVGGSGPAQAGYADVTLTSGAVPYGIAAFSYRQNGTVVNEAGVPVSPPTTAARIFIDYRSSVAAIPARTSAGAIDINTGIAVVNRGSASANLTFTLRDMAGTTRSTGHGTLAAGAHFAKFIDQLKAVAQDFVLPADFQTSTQFASLEISSDQLISVLALRMTTNQRNEALFTTTPTADLAALPDNGPAYFPQFADGGGYTTALVLLNTSNGTETGTFQILDDEGTPLVVNRVGGTADSSFRYAIPPGGAYRFQTDGSPADTRAGWVQLTADPGTRTPVGAGIFGYNPESVLVTESGISAAAVTTHARVYVDLSGGHNTGLAIGNPSGATASITISAYQADGATGIGTNQGPLLLAGNGHSAKFADQFIAGLPPEFTGVLDISSATPFAALTLRSLNNERNDFLLTTFPIADATRSAPAPIVFPQIVDGGGYVTQLILLSPGGASNATLRYYSETGTPLAVGK